MKRGDIVTVAVAGDYGKPRPALIVQADFFQEHPSFTVLLLTSTLRDAPLFRIAVAPTPKNGLAQPSQIMVDKAHTVARERIGGVIGRLDDDTMVAVTRALAVFLGFA